MRKSWEREREKKRGKSIWICEDNRSGWSQPSELALAALGSCRVWREEKREEEREKRVESKTKKRERTNSKSIKFEQKIKNHSIEIAEGCEESRERTAGGNARAICRA